MSNFLDKYRQIKSAATEKKADSIDVLRALAEQFSGAGSMSADDLGAGAFGAAKNINDVLRETGISPEDFGDSLSNAGKLMDIQERGRRPLAEQFNQRSKLLDLAMREQQGSFGGQMQRGLAGEVSKFIGSPLRGIAGAIESTLSAPGTTYGYRLNKAMNNGFKGLMNRVQAPDVAAKKFIETSAGRMADSATGLLADMSSKAMSGLTDALVDSPARKALLRTLRQEDDIIANMGEQEVLDAFHTITKFAPTLAKDKNAVRSALRMAAQTEGGLSYHTIKGLADAENAVARAKAPQR